MNKFKLKRRFFSRAVEAQIDQMLKVGTVDEDLLEDTEEELDREM